MIKPSKTYVLHDKQSSYLLLISHDFIITNNNYCEVMLLTHKLKFVRTVQLPKKDFICFYAYKEKGGNHFLFYEDEGEMFALLDVAMGNTRLIRDDILKTITVESSYIWIDNTFTALTYSGYPNNPGILSVDTLTEDVTLISFEDRYKRAPQLARYLDIYTSHKAWPIRCNQDYLACADFKQSPIVQIVDLSGAVMKTSSIEEELKAELARLNGKLRAERFPHDIDYQSDWMLLVWEGKVVIIDPNDQRTTVLMNDCDYSTRAKFIIADNSHAQFIILVQNDLKKTGAELRLYEVTTSKNKTQLA